MLIVDGDILSRHALADYLRHCGYSVVEAADTDEALIALGDSALRVDVILCDVAAVGTQSAFELSNWVRANQPELEVRLAGNTASAADAAADLCESGPNLARPYEPQSVVDYINRLRAGRKPGVT
ncbi:MAG TPA: response regulator [Brevundimonas sp.]|nr:response regulator [Brevundimonas sp.]